MDSSAARPCVGGCGFFGTVENRWFCSKCYISDPLNVKTMVEFDAAMGNRLSRLQLKTINVEGNGDGDDEDATMNPRFAKKNRCRLCNKKVGLLGFQCRSCGLTFCGTHRYPEEHFCRIDFKKSGETIIHKDNPLCKSDKLTHRI